MLTILPRIFQTISSEAMRQLLLQLNHQYQQHQMLIFETTAYQDLDKFEIQALVTIHYEQSDGDHVP